MKDEEVREAINAIYTKLTHLELDLGDLRDEVAASRRKMIIDSAFYEESLSELRILITRK